MKKCACESCATVSREERLIRIIKRLLVAHLGKACKTRVYSEAQNIVREFYERTSN